MSKMEKNSAKTSESLVKIEHTDSIDFYPFAYALYNEYLTTYCWYCLNDDKKHKRCTGCTTAIFCDKECQTLAWKDHKFECKALKSSKSVPDIEIRLLGRIVVRYKAILCGKDKNDPNFYKDRMSRRSIMDIWAHTKKISNDTYAMKKFNDIYESFVTFYDSKALLSKDIIFQLHCRDFINRHAISDKAYIKEIGKGLYLDLCAYDHSCRPNSIYVCDGVKATLRALNSETNLLDRSTTFYSYIDLLYGKSERQKLLKDTWYFHCECERCQDNTEHILLAINCPHCKSIPPQRLCFFGEQPYKDKETQLITCPRCLKTLSREEVMEGLGAMRFIDDLLQKTNFNEMEEKAALDVLFNLLGRFEYILPKVNIYYCKIVQALIPIINPNNSRLLLDLHLSVEECINICYPHNHPALGFHLRNIGIFYLRLKEYDNAIKYLQKALNIFEFVMRSEHCLTKTTKSFLEEALSLLKDSTESVATTSLNVHALINNEGGDIDERLSNKDQTVDECNSNNNKTITVEKSIGKATKKVMLRCEVFAESFDYDKTTDNCISNNATSDHHNDDLKKSESNNKTSCVDNKDDDRKQAVNHNVVLFKQELNAKAEAIQPLKTECKQNEQEKREELNNCNLAKSNLNLKLKESETPNSLNLNNSQSHSKDILQSNLLSKNKLDSNHLLIQPIVDNLCSKNSQINIPILDINVVSHNKSKNITTNNLFVDTHNDLVGNNGFNSSTGVKKKAALKKFSPRARTPIPPFIIGDAQAETLLETSTASETNLLSIHSCTPMENDRNLLNACSNKAKDTAISESITLNAQNKHSDNGKEISKKEKNRMKNAKLS